MGYNAEKVGILATLIRPETQKSVTNPYHKRALSRDNTVSFVLEYPLTEPQEIKMPNKSSFQTEMQFSLKNEQPIVISIMLNIKKFQSNLSILH